MIPDKETRKTRSTRGNKAALIDFIDKKKDPGFEQAQMSNIVDDVRSDLARRNVAIANIYNDRRINQIVKGTLVKMGCDKNYCEDYFSEAVVNFIKACYRPDFEFKTSLANYLTGIAKNIWLKEVTNKKNQSTIGQRRLNHEETVESPEIVLIKGEKLKILRTLLDELDEPCRKVLTLWSFNKRMKEIAESMNYKSEGMARKKKHQCLRRLYEIVDKNPTLKEQLR